MSRVFHLGGGRQTRNPKPITLTLKLLALKYVGMNEQFARIVIDHQPLLPYPNAYLFDEDNELRLVYQPKTVSVEELEWAVNSQITFGEICGQLAGIIVENIVNMTQSQPPQFELPTFS